MGKAIRESNIGVIQRLSKFDLPAQLDGGTARLRYASVYSEKIEVLELLVQTGYKDLDGSALNAACAEKNLYYAHLLLRNFGDRPGYVNNQNDTYRRSPFISAVSKGQVKLARLLLDYGANSDDSVVLYPVQGGSGIRYSVLIEDIKRNHSEPERDARMKAIESMILRIPAIRGNSWAWPLILKKKKKKEKVSQVSEAFSRMLVSMRTRAPQKVILVRVRIQHLA